MRKGRNKPSMPSPESFWKLGHDTYRDLRSELESTVQGGLFNEAYFLFLEEQAADALLARLDAVQVGQWRVALREIFVGLLDGAEDGLGLLYKFPEDEDFIENQSDSVSVEEPDLRA